MKYRTEKHIVGDDGKRFRVGDTVSFYHPNGAGCCGVQITKITDTGFHYSAGGRREKSVQYKDLEEIDSLN
ncbi:hypothetical protein NE683_15140 [Bariatricus massiliensis]|uniref:Uncharacterized protein n=1 Tax=Bariatricus massiliensis TaxID=1745713 RepID=A0ABS8DHH3_9FIRM|nr:hypothetical protein [Bariatricus massiliensis]MCB7304838.1 hypothetical protein [Bariatricus massiliensis]MCB7375392.1 hypothetical protein [Bariatricus massiliensis]MCB7387852.1 hypothetical protein [Bariatricus massiliensis]MCB7412059.1 hypothetical protein [Bariatricus massiliensis]MCQ5254560.1 hypothetical protein [Bariatricus massiliensis]